MEEFLRKVFKHKELGWYEIGERFTRYSLFKSNWLNLYLHQLSCPNEHTLCHDHPWWFITVILWKGYLETTSGKEHRRYPGMVLYRPADHMHKVLTPFGTSWSLVITGPKGRDWGFKPCERTPNAT